MKNINKSTNGMGFEGVRSADNPNKIIFSKGFSNKSTTSSSSTSRNTTSSNISSNTRTVSTTSNSTSQSTTSSSRSNSNGNGYSSNTSSRKTTTPNVEAVFKGTNSVSGKTPAGAEFLNTPIGKLKGVASSVSGGTSSRNSGTISYDLDKDIMNMNKIVNKATEKSTNTAVKSAVTAAFGPAVSGKNTNNNTQQEKKESKSMFSKIKDIIFGSQKKQESVIKGIAPSTVNYKETTILRENLSGVQANNKVSTESKIESITGRTSNNNYTDYDVDKLASLIYRETGGSFRNSGESEEWFTFLNTGAVAMNNQARSGKGDSVGDRICSLSNNVYAGLSDYANTDFDTVTAGATEEQKEKIRNAAKMVLSGQYTLPSNMYLQASAGIVNKYGNTWNVHNPTTGGMDVHIGYEGSSASTTDLYGNEVPTDVESYRSEAETLRLALESTDNTANNHLSDLRPNDIRQL